MQIRIALLRQLAILATLAALATLANATPASATLAHANPAHANPAHANLANANLATPGHTNLSNRNLVTQPLLSPLTAVPLSGDTCHSPYPTANLESVAYGRCDSGKACEGTDAAGTPTTTKLTTRRSSCNSITGGAIRI